MTIPRQATIVAIAVWGARSLVPIRRLARAACLSPSPVPQGPAWIAQVLDADVPGRSLPAFEADLKVLQKRARLLNHLGNRLSDLGHREEAVRIYAVLVERWPQAFMEDFRISVGNLIKRVTEGGGSAESDPVVREASALLEKLGAGGREEEGGTEGP